MTAKVRLWIVGVTIVAVSGLIGVTESSYAGGEKEIRDAVVAIAANLKAGDKEGAKKAAAAAAKKIDEMGDLMHMFRTRDKGAVGVGGTPGIVKKEKDGIEVKLRDLARDVPTAAALAKEAPALEEGGYYIAAIAELAAAKGWPKDTGKKTKKEWTKFSSEMSDLGIAFAKAAKGKGAQEIKTAAAKINANCTNCHNIFKE